MRVTWITNVPVADEQSDPRVASGGWLDVGLKELRARSSTDVTVLSPDFGWTAGLVANWKTPTPGTFRAISLEDLPTGTENLTRLIRETDPDLVHIHGTEYPHSYAALLAARNLGVPVVVSIQGLIGEIAKSYLDGVPARVAQQQTLRDRLRWGSLMHQSAEYARRGEIEKRSLAGAVAIIGRTAWDRSFATEHAKGVPYWHINESLRDSFYAAPRIDIHDREKTILMPSPSTPIKGFHLVVDALAQLLEQDLDLSVRILGGIAWRRPSLKQRMRETAYQRHIRGVATSRGITGRLTSLGSLNETHMREEMDRAGILLLPSVLENSPNTVGEAMMSGLPVVATKRGGVSSIIADGSEGLLVEPSDTSSVVEAVRALLYDPEASAHRAVRARKRAESTHDRRANTDRLVGLYSTFARDR